LPAPRPTAVVLSPETPYPLHGGGALRTASVVQYLARHRDVDLIVFRHRPEQDPIAALPPGLVRRALVIDLPHHRKDLLARVWRNGVRFIRGVPPLVDRFRGFGDRIDEFLAGHRYQVAVIEHFWCAEYQPILRAASDAAVLNLHNVESVLHETSAAASAGLGRLVHGRFARNCRVLERKWLPEFAELLTASEPDAERIRQISPGAKPRVFPNSIPWTEIPARAEEDVIAFSGNLEYHPNQEAVTFFAGKIWPHVVRRRPSLKWRLIGMNPEAVRSSVIHCLNVEFTGSVLDAVAEIAAAKVVVVPLLSGSGTRLKIVEAWAAGRAVVSTRLGAEGLPARDKCNILLADTPPDFVSCIERLLSDAGLRRALGDAGRQEYERGFCWEAAWKALDSTWLAADSVHSADF
jgi:glycosyltransferase involved in cell wall biosynthesis